MKKYIFISEDIDLLKLKYINMKILFFTKILIFVPNYMTKYMGIKS